MSDDDDATPRGLAFDREFVLRLNLRTATLASILQELERRLGPELKSIDCLTVGRPGQAYFCTSNAANPNDLNAG
jgi:hypothetical protein